MFKWTVPSDQISIRVIYVKGLFVPYKTGAKASPRQFVLRHGINTRKLQFGDAFVTRTDLEEADRRLGSPY